MASSPPEPTGGGGRGRYGLAVVGTPRLLGIPAVLWFVTAVVLGIVQTVHRTHATERLFSVVQYRVFPVVFALCAVALVASFFTRRRAGDLDKASRRDHRFVAFLLTAMSIFGAASGFVVPLVVCAVCWLVMHVPTRDAA